MTPEFEEALARWETGELSRDELSRRFPDEDVAGLLSTFERMQAAGTGPTPDPTEAWEAVRQQLPVRFAKRRKRSRGIRLLAAALVALVALGATAYAFVPGVRRAIGAALDESTSTHERSPGATVGSVDPILTSEPAEEDEPAFDEPDPDEDEGSPGSEGRHDEESDEQGHEQGEDPPGNAQGEDGDAGSGEGTDDEGTSGGDQTQGTQDSDSQQGSDGADQGGTDQGGGQDADQVGQSGDSGD
jgi:hypothetical protein